MSNEKEIRELFRPLLVKAYDGAIVVDEFCGGTMKTRTDLACISLDTIVMVEIKSDKDTLSRLENQIRDYHKYSSEVFVVLDVKHKEKYLDNRDIYEHHMVCFYDRGRIVDVRGTEYSIPRRRRPHERLRVDISELLWSQEKRNIMQLFRGYTKVPASMYLDCIYYVFTVAEVVDLSHEILLNRWEYLSKQSKRYQKGYSGATFKQRVDHLEHKQKLFDEFVREVCGST